MSKKIDFNFTSYSSHIEHFKNHVSGEKNENLAKTWLDDSTVDAWRHKRMYRLLDPILNSDKNAKWLTIGDGRYGKDAKYILDRGGNALASDISDFLLKEAKNIGYINKYHRENAESLSFQDEQFDYVLCKESYHHFPRPMIALYEMLRVSKKGVILIEPNDHLMDMNFLEFIISKLESLMKSYICKEKLDCLYEPSGNYVYSVSKREIEKVCLGMDYRFVALKGLNDAYVYGVEYEKINEKGPLQKKVRRKINFLNILCKFNVRKYGILGIIIFKQSPSSELIISLEKDGFDTVHFPGNPYNSKNE